MPSKLTCKLPVPPPTDNVTEPVGLLQSLSCFDPTEMLNAVGYGIEGTGLVLDLVYNPVGAFLPAAQQGLEADFQIV